MNTINNVLIWLSGKKSVIASLIMTTVGYMGAKGTISPDDIVYIGSIVAIVFGTASYATAKAIYYK